MLIENANADLALEVKRIVVADMAQRLIEENVDLESDAAVAEALHRSRFGAASIANLMEYAKTVARKTRGRDCILSLAAAAAFAFCVYEGFILPASDDSLTATRMVSQSENRSFGSRG